MNHGVRARTEDFMHDTRPTNRGPRTTGCQPLLMRERAAAQRDRPQRTSELEATCRWRGKTVTGQAP